MFDILRFWQYNVENIRKLWLYLPIQVTTQRKIEKLNNIGNLQLPT